MINTKETIRTIVNLANIEGVYISIRKKVDFGFDSRIRVYNDKKNDFHNVLIINII